MDNLPKRNNTHCSVPQCTSRGSKNPELSFHTFPHIKSQIVKTSPNGSRFFVNRRQEWSRILRIGKPISERMSVCSKHFVEDDYNLPAGTCKRPRLRPSAVPSRFLPVLSTDNVKENSIGAKKAVESNIRPEIIKRKLNCEKPKLQPAPCASNNQKDSSYCERNKDEMFPAKENTANKDCSNEESSLEVENEQLNITKPADKSISKLKPIKTLPGLFQFKLFKYANEGASERIIFCACPSSKEPEYDTSKNLNSEIEKSDSNSEPRQTMCILKKCFTYEKLAENLLHITKPNHWWTISSVNYFIVCARWNKDYIVEKKVVIENTLTIRVFLKEMEIDITDLMDITCIDDISNLLQKVENYKT